MRKLLLVIALAAFAGPAVSQEQYPSRPITMVIPFAAGGPLDTLGRSLIDKMQQSLGQAVIIENVSGAGGASGVGRVARAAPDGYTILMGNWTSNVGAPAIYPIQFDVLKDFEPIALLADAPLFIIAKKGFPANTLPEMIAWLRANPDKATSATLGPGSASGLVTAYFQQTTRTKFQMVPYRGGAAAVQDIVAGHVDLRFGIEASQALPYIRNGNVKAFAVMAKERSAVVPEIPTTDEGGVSGLYISFWNGLWAPKGTPKPALDKLNTVVRDALADPRVKQRIEGLGQDIPSSEQLKPEALGAFHKAELDRWWPIIKAANIKAE